MISPFSRWIVIVSFFVLGSLDPSWSNANERPRLAICTDIGGDPDDQQSLIRLLLYANEFDIELLIASASGTRGELKEAVVRPDLIQTSVDAYQQVLPHLAKHADGWPSPDALRKAIKRGNPLRGLEHIGEGKDTDASRALIDRIDHGIGKLNIAIWGGQTDFAQAVWRVKKDRSVEEFSRFVQRFRVYDINDQDGIAEWMRSEFPGMHYILASCYPGRDKREGVYRGMYLTGDLSLTSAHWIQEHIRIRNPLGSLYPTQTWTAPNPHRCMKEGDTPSWFFFLPKGGNDPDDPTKPGWGGTFVRQPDGWYRDPEFRVDQDPRESVSRWRPQFQADFAERMSWTIPSSP